MIIESVNYLETKFSYGEYTCKAWLRKSTEETTIGLGTPFFRSYIIELNYGSNLIDIYNANKSEYSMFKPGNPKVDHHYNLVVNLTNSYHNVPSGVVYLGDAQTEGTRITFATNYGTILFPNPGCMGCPDLWTTNVTGVNVSN